MSGHDLLRFASIRIAAVCDSAMNWGLCRSRLSEAGRMWAVPYMLEDIQCYALIAGATLIEALYDAEEADPHNQQAGGGRHEGEAAQAKTARQARLEGRLEAEEALLGHRRAATGTQRQRAGGGPTHSPRIAVVGGSPAVWLPGMQPGTPASKRMRSNAGQQAEPASVRSTRASGCPGRRSPAATQENGEEVSMEGVNNIVGWCRHRWRSASRRACRRCSARGQDRTQGGHGLSTSVIVPA